MGFGVGTGSDVSLLAWVVTGDGYDMKMTISLRGKSIMGAIAK